MFFLIKQKIKQYLFFIKLALGGVVLIYIAYLLIKCANYEEQIKSYEEKSVMSAQIALTQEALYKLQASQSQLRWSLQRVKANEAYTHELQLIHADYNKRLFDSNRVQVSTEKIIKYLPDLSRAAVENVAKTTADGVSECAAILTEVESVARGYSAEIDKLISEYPKPE